MKKIISILSILSIVMVSSFAFLIPVSAQTTQSGSCGGNVVWSFDSATGELVISGEGEMINSPWFTGCETDVESVTVQSGVTSLSSRVFLNYRNLKFVSLPQTLTKIGGDAFYNCSALTAIDIPSNVTEIGSEAFSGCEKLTNIVIPNGVTEIKKRTFYFCENLESVNIPNGVLSIGENAFDRCFKLSSITIPDSVKSIGDYAFHNCDALESIAVPEGVTFIGMQAFSSCDILEEVLLPSSLETLGEGAFSMCEALTSIVIPKGITTIEYSAFSSCRSLQSIAIPDSVTSVYPYAFSGCEQLKEVYYYCGTQTAWDSIKSEFPSDVTVYFHRFDYDGGETINPPTHTEQGTKKVFCVDCEAEGTWFIDTTPEHTMSDNWQPHTQTKHKKVCACGYEVYADHHWQSVETIKEATHDDYGQVLHACTDCGATYISYSSKAHCSFGVKPWEPHNETQHKQECYCPLVRYANHTWDSGKVTTEPTATEDGIKTYTCNVCGGTKTEVIKKLSGGEVDENTDSVTDAITEAVSTSESTGGGCSSFIYSSVPALAAVTLIGATAIRKRQKKSK